MNILIVEDEVLLALELDSELRLAGHNVVGAARSSDEAIAMIEAHGPELCFVDIHLTDGPTGIRVGQHLATRAIPYVFVTGNVKRIPPDFAGALGAIEKPYSIAGFRSVLTYLTALIKGMADDPVRPPPSLVVAKRPASAGLAREPALIDRPPAI